MENKYFNNFILSRKIFIVLVVSFVATSLMVNYSAAAGNPTVTITSPRDASQLMANSSSTFTSPQNNYHPQVIPTTVKGTATSGGNALTRVQVSIDGNPYQNATGTSTWSIALAPLSIGMHEIRDLVTDSVGNVGTIDAIVNEVSIPVSDVVTSPANNTKVSTSTPTITGKAASSAGYVITQVQVSIDGGPTRNAIGTTSWSYTSTALSSGTHSLNVFAKDSAGWTALTKIKFTV